MAWEWVRRLFPQPSLEAVAPPDSPLLARLRGFTLDPQLMAFSHVLRQGESNQLDSAFNLLVYGSRFDGFADHPRQHFARVSHAYVADWKKAPAYSTTSAAGAFQITETTWDRFCKATGWSGGFTPEGQWVCALWLIDDAAATRDLVAGDLPVGIAKLCKVWTSLPGGPEQRLTMNRAALLFQQYGGTLRGQA